jgi:hypothetical protein
VIAALILALSLIAHTRAQNDVRVVAVALDPDDPARERLGELIYRGGLQIPPMGQNIGGLSALRWDDDSGRLLALTDDARWVWITPVEANGRLTGIASFEVGHLLGLAREPLTGKEQGDTESLTRSAGGGWLVGFERDHRVWRYAALGSAPQATSIDPRSLLGDFADNNGLETMASLGGTWIGCAERAASAGQPNCVRVTQAGETQLFSAFASPAIADLGGVPTDADMASDGTLYVLFRSYSRADGSGAAIMALSPDGRSYREITTIRPPLTIDNFEGLAVREEDGRTLLYIVSDDNFSPGQRTLLLKFEVLAQQ